MVSSVCRPNPDGKSSRPVLISGATGTLGRGFARICERRGLAYYLLNRQELDIADIRSVETVLERFEPWALINAAGFVRVDDAEHERETCLRENYNGPALLARTCKAHDIALLTFSSDLVFNGMIRRPYLESDRPAPLNVYGATKLKAERTVLQLFPQALVIRTSAFFGPWDDYNFASAALNALSQGSSFRAANDATISPTYVPDLVNACLDLLIDGEHGIWHLANRGSLTWADFARLLANQAGYGRARIEGHPGRSLGLKARRPAYSALASERGTLLPALEDAIDRYLAETARSRPPEIANSLAHRAGLRPWGA